MPISEVIGTVLIGRGTDRRALMRCGRSVECGPFLTQVPGTWVRKGPHSTERPHRMSALLSVPRPIKTVPMTSLIGIKRYAPPAPPANAKGNSAPINDRRLKAFFETYADELTVD